MNMIEHPRLYRLLGTYGNSTPVQSKRIEEEIASIFGQNATVLIIDMAGFSKITQQQGIFYYLSLIKRMQDVVSMAVTRHKGTVIKFLADNAFIILDSPSASLACVEDIHHSLTEENKLTPHMHPIRIATGIDCGHILNINNSDMFGDPVNVASLLGEDTAKADEIMMTQRAFDCLSEADKQGWEFLTITCSGVDVDVAKRVYKPKTQS